jgi:hypothetical protein
MSGRVSVRYDGDEFDPDALVDADFRRRVIEHGEIFVDGKAVTKGRAARIRMSLLEETAPLRLWPSEPYQVGRELIPGLWRWGTIAMLGGQYKAGKSTLVADLCAALVIPGRLFLDQFGPVQWGEREGDAIWLINAENPRDDLHEALLATGLEYHDDGDVPCYSAEGSDIILIVVHLDDESGPESFDLREPANTDLWNYHMSLCPCGPGFEPPPPLAVIADGVTAMIGSAENEGYGQWFAGFKLLLRMLGTSNGLAVGHTEGSGKHLKRGTASAAGPDALWTYWSADPDNADAARWFKVQPRLGGPKVDVGRVVINAEGRLRYVPPDARVTATKAVPTGYPAAQPDVDLAERTERIVSTLRASGSRGAWTVELTGRGDEGQENRKALDRLLREGRVVMRPVQEGRARGNRWWLTEHADGPGDAT